MQQQLEKTTARHDRIAVSALEEISEPQNRKQIAALACEFWQARGCPDGTPDEDWFRAEREIAGSKRIDENEVGSLGSAQRSIDDVGADDEEVESRGAAERSIDAEKADSPTLRFPVRCELFQATHKRVSRRA